MKQKIQCFFSLLNKADLVTVDDGPYLHSWVSEDPGEEINEDNQVVHFTWESEGNDYSSILTEGGIAHGTYHSEDGKFVCEDHEGALTVIRFYKAAIVKDEEPINNNEPVKVRNWDKYGQQEVTAEATHLSAIHDQRVSNGQIYVDMTAVDGDPDKTLEITHEVNSNPLNQNEHVPCAHIHFNGNELAVSLFKVGNKILVRPETDVWIESFRGDVNGISEDLYWIKTGGLS